jgi:hypothetical protein
MLCLNHLIVVYDATNVCKLQSKNCCVVRKIFTIVESPVGSAVRWRKIKCEATEGWACGWRCFSFYFAEALARHLFITVG